MTTNFTKHFFFKNFRAASFYHIHANKLKKKSIQRAKYIYQQKSSLYYLNKIICQKNLQIIFIIFCLASSYFFFSHKKHSSVFLSFFLLWVYKIKRFEVEVFATQFHEVDKIIIIKNESRMMKTENLDEKKNWKNWREMRKWTIVTVTTIDLHICPRKLYTFSC